MFLNEKAAQSMIDLLPFKTDIEKICQELSLQRLDLIGSAARDDFSAESDIDVLVTFAGDEHLFERYFSLQARLEAIFKRKVDIIEERAIRNPFFKKAVEKDRVRVYGT
jgi:predicted nucleotidyltransferase